MENATSFSEPSSPRSHGVFVGMFLTPRRAVRALLDGGPSVGGTIVLAMIAGVVSRFDNGIQHHLETETPMGLALTSAALGGGILGLIGFFLFGWMYRLIGRLLGGSGSQWDIYHALAWTRIPSIVGIVPLIAMAMMVSQGQVDTPPYLGALLMYLGLLVWGAVSAIRGLAEAHRFSSWRSLATAAICAIILVGIVFAFFFTLMVVLPD